MYRRSLLKLDFPTSGAVVIDSGLNGAGKLNYPFEGQIYLQRAADLAEFRAATRIARASPSHQAVPARRNRRKHNFLNQTGRPGSDSNARCAQLLSPFQTPEPYNPTPAAYTTGTGLNYQRHHDRSKSRSVFATTTRLTQLSSHSLFDEVRNPLADHQDGDVDVGAYALGHDRGVDHAQAVSSVYLAVLVDDGHGV